MNHTKNTPLFVVGIILIVFSAIALVLNLVNFGALSEFKGHEKYTLVLMATIFSTLLAVCQLLTGIYAVVQKNAKLAMIFGGILLAFRVVDMILAIIVGVDAAAIIGALFGFALPILIIFFAYKLMKDNENYVKEMQYAEQRRLEEQNKTDQE